MEIRRNSFLNNIVYRKTHGLGAGLAEFSDPIQCYNLRSWDFTTLRVIYKYDNVDYSFRALDTATGAPIDGTMAIHVCDTPDNIEKFIVHPDIFFKDINYNGKTNEFRIGARDFVEGGWFEHGDGSNWVNRYYTNQTLQVSYQSSLEEITDFKLPFHHHEYPGKSTDYIRRIHINPDEDFYLLTFRTHDYLTYLAAKSGINPIKRMLAFSDRKFMRCVDILEFIDLIRANKNSLEKNLENLRKNFSEKFVENFPKYF